MRKQYYIPTTLYGESNHYIPNRARTAEHSPFQDIYEAEIERRRAEPGTLIYKNQLRGIRVSAFVLQELATLPDTKFATRLIASAAYSTAYYLYGANHEETRRHLDLPIVKGSRGYTKSRKEMMLQAKSLLDISELATIPLTAKNVLSNTNTAKLKKKTGQALGNASMVLAGADALVGAAKAGSTADAQIVAYANAKRTMVNSLNLHKLIGVHPSMAAIGDENSTLSDYWRSSPKVPMHVSEAYENALAENKTLFQEELLSAQISVR